MSTVTGIRGEIFPGPQLAQEAHVVGREDESGRRNVATSEHDTVTGLSLEELEAAVRDLSDAIARLPGSSREVHLLFMPEDRTYLIEIRNKDTGAVVQTFPPEILLNLGRRSADLLGVLLDCHS